MPPQDFTVGRVFVPGGQPAVTYNPRSALQLEAPELFRITRLSELAMSHIADNVVLLQHLHSGHEMKRALTVLKTRGASHASAVREFHITSEGIALGEPLDLEVLAPMTTGPGRGESGGRPTALRCAVSYAPKPWTPLRHRPEAIAAPDVSGHSDP